MKNRYMKTARLMLMTGALLLTGKIGFSQGWQPKIDDEKVNFWQIQKEFNTYWETHDKEKEKGYKPFKRWENRILPFVDKDGHISQENPKNTLTDFLEQTPAPAPMQWTSLGPASTAQLPKGLGRLWCFDMHPYNQSVIFAGSENGGLYKSTTGGNYWFENPGNIKFENVYAVTVDYAAVNTVYVAGVATSVSSNRRIYKSTDGGNTFQPISTMYLGREVAFIKQNPHNPLELYVGSKGGLYKSSDGGSTWTQMNLGDVTAVVDLAFLPSLDRVYCSFNSPTGGQVKYASVNGTTWYHELSGVPSYTKIERRNNALYVCQINDGDFIVRKKDFNQPPNLIKWNTISTGYFIRNQKWIHNVFVVPPGSGQELIVGSVYAKKSSDGGQTWGTFAPGIHIDFKQVKYVSPNWYAATDGGFYKSTDNGATWSFLSDGLDITEIYYIEGREDDANKLYIGTQDNNFARYDNGVWTNFGFGDGMEVESNPDNPDFQYSISQNGGSFNYTTDGWHNFSSVPDINIDGAWETPITFDPSNSSKVYVGGKKLYRVTNTEALPGKDPQFEIDVVKDFGTKIGELVVGRTGQELYAAFAHTIQYSWDNGQNWHEIDLRATDPNITYITAIKAAPNDQYRLYVAVGKSTNGVFSTDVLKLQFYNSNGSVGTTSLKHNLPDHVVRCIEPIEGGNDYLYVGTSRGLFYYTPANNWEFLNGNMPAVEIADIKVHYGSGKVRVGTYGRGVWEATHINTANLWPVIDFEASPRFACQGSGIQFTNKTSSGNFYYWVFPGGTPSYYMGETPPPVVYGAPGKYDVTLHVFNNNGSSYKHKGEYVHVLGGSGHNAPYTLDFNNIPVNTHTSMDGWVNNPSSGTGWVVKDGPSQTNPQEGPSTGRGGNGNFITLDANPLTYEVATLESPCINLAGLTNPVLEFWYHFNGPNGFPSVEVGASDGDQFYELDNITLDNGGASGLGDVWHRRQIDLSAFVGKEIRVMIFGSVGRFHQVDLALDDIAIVDAPTADFTYPTPIYQNQFLVFTDQSQGAAAWEWTFENAVLPTSTIQNPGNIFASPGGRAVTLKVTDAYGRTDEITKSIWVNPTTPPPFGGPVGFKRRAKAEQEEVALDEETVISPNPSNGLYTVQLPSGNRATLTVYNSMGQKVLQAENTKATELDIRDYPNGIYILHIQHEGGQEIKQLIKQ